jgi:uncharacterized membrane protein
MRKYWELWKDALAISATFVTIGLFVGLLCGIEDTWLGRWAQRIPVVALVFFIVALVAALCIRCFSRRRPK